MRNRVIPEEWRFLDEYVVVDNDDILDLRSNHIARGDDLAVAICERALTGLVPYRLFYSLTGEQRKVVELMGQWEARKRCALEIERENRVPTQCGFSENHFPAS